VWSISEDNTANSRRLVINLLKISLVVEAKGNQTGNTCLSESIDPQAIDQENAHMPTVTQRYIDSQLMWNPRSVTLSCA
jgi:hypothetical protein